MDSIYIPYQEFYPNLEKALKNGAKIHIFRSGGGLRVVRVKKENKLISYGEYPFFSGALAHAESDFGLSYEEQYLSKHPRHHHYLTGAYPIPYDILDIFVYGGRTLDILYSTKDEKFICVRSAPDLPESGRLIWGTGNHIQHAISECISTTLFSDPNIAENKMKFMVKHHIAF